MLTRGLLFIRARKPTNCIKPLNSSYYTTKAPCPNPPKSTKSSSIFIKAVAAGAIVGVTYSLYSHYTLNQKKSKPKVYDEVRPKLLKTMPDVKITRKITNLGKESDLDLILFQYQSCPFCSKVRAFLNANGISYSIVEVDSISRKAVKWSDYKKVPTLLVKTKNGYLQLTDSSAIISILSSYMLDKSQNLEDIINYYPILTYIDDEGRKKDEILNKYFLMFKDNTSATKEVIERERQWRKWTDDVLMHTICPNIYRTVEESFKTLNFFADVGEWNNVFGSVQSWMMVHGGTYAMWAVGKLVKKKYKYDDDVRIPLYEACSQWSKEVSMNKGPFMGGSTPDLSDLAVYGLLNCIEGSDAFSDVLENTNIKPWFQLMKDYIVTHKNNVAK